MCMASNVQIAFIFYLRAFKVLFLDLSLPVERSIRSLLTDVGAGKSV